MKNPARQSAANWGSDSVGRAGIEGALSSAGRIEECQSTQVPMRSKTMALGTAGDVDTADILMEICITVDQQRRNQCLGRFPA